MSGGLSYGSYIGKDKLTIEKTKINFLNLPNSLYGIRITQISDIHGGIFMDVKTLNYLVDVVNKLNSDIIVITGDIINFGTHYIDQTVEVLAKLKAPLGVYAVLGNHDFLTDVRRLCHCLKEASIQVLRNRWIKIGNFPLYLIGVDDPWAPWIWSKTLTRLDKATIGLPEEGFYVLLSHRPTIFPEAIEKKIPLTLSGHTHAGQFILPLPVKKAPSLAKLLFPWDYGLYEQEGHYLYVNRGLGVVGPPVRINCPREITQIILKKI